MSNKPKWLNKLINSFMSNMDVMSKDFKRLTVDEQREKINHYMFPIVKIKEMIINNDPLKVIQTDKYMIVYNMNTGFELLMGINGNQDPKSLEFPSLLDIGIMGHCKNKCEFCYQGDLYQENMKLKHFKYIIDQCKDHTNSIALGGRGDPNHHENFEEIVRYARENNIVPNYTTSGIGLTKEQILITKKYCGAVAVSMYNKPHTFRALRMFMDLGMKTNIHYLYSKKSHDEAIQILNGYNPWKSEFDINKLNAVIFLRFKPQGRGKNLKRDDWIPSKKQFLEFGQHLKKYNGSFKVGCDSCLVNVLKNNNQLSDSEEIYVDTCEATRASAYITPDYRMLPCSFSNYYQSVNLNLHSIQEVWSETPVFKECRKYLIDNPASCPFGL